MYHTNTILNHNPILGLHKLALAISGRYIAFTEIKDRIQYPSKHTRTLKYKRDIDKQQRDRRQRDQSGTHVHIYLYYTILYERNTRYVYFQLIKSCRTIKIHGVFHEFETAV